MQEIVRLNAIEQLHENVTHAEERTPDDQETVSPQNPSVCTYPKIHHDVLTPFLPLPFHSLLLQNVIEHVTSSHRSLLASSASSAARAPLVAAPPNDVFSSAVDESSQTSSGRTRSGFSAQLRSSSLWTLPLRSSPSPAQPSPHVLVLFPLLCDTTKKSLHMSRALNDDQHQWL